MDIYHDQVSRKIRIRLDEEDFDRLTSGEIIKGNENAFNGIEIALADIGYEKMIRLLEPKLKKLIYGDTPAKEWRQELLEQIESVSSLTDFSKVVELKRRIELMNTQDPLNKPIFDAANRML